MNDQYEHDVAPLAPEDWSDPSLRAPLRRAGFLNDQFVSNRPSIGRRMFRAVSRFFIAVLIGVGATLAWQSHGDEAKEMVSTWAPSLGWLLSVSTTKSTSDGQVSAQDAALAQSVPFTQIPAPPVPAPPAALTSPEVVQQLEPIARDLAALRRSLEQIAAKQEQMVQNIATLQAAEQDLRQTLASPPPSRTVPLPPRRPPQLAAQSSAVQSLSVPPPPPSTQLPLPLR